MTQSEDIARLNAFRRPDWQPRVPDGSRILVAGATGGLGRAVVNMLIEGSDCVVGAHGGTGSFDAGDDPRIVPLQRMLETEADCAAVVDAFRDEAGGLDALVSLNGRLTRTEHWDNLTESQWRDDVLQNLHLPFFLARCALRVMKAQGTSGSILLNGTESALHGGSAQSFPYSVAKRGTEAMVQGLAREGASSGVRVNGVRMGCIDSGFHQRWMRKDESDMETRVELIPMKRPGHVDEVAALFIYLLSDWSRFISGQMFAITGGDWL